MEAQALSMQMLYDSDEYVVVHISYGPDDTIVGFEIVDKAANKGVFLTGEWADSFQKYIDRWEANTPYQEAVDKALSKYAVLAQNPLIYH